MNISFDQEANREVDFDALDLSSFEVRFSEVNKVLDQKAYLYFSIKICKKQIQRNFWQ
jgi:hypothetical protein